MIVDVAVSADALRDDQDLEPARLADLHQQLTRVLLAHGDIVVANPDAERYLHDSVRALASLSPDAAKYWEAVLAGRRIALAQPEVAAPLEAIETLPELRDNWGGKIDSALIEELRALTIGCPANGVAELDAPSGIEVAHIFACAASTTFGGLRHLADQTAIPAGTDRDSIASERLVPAIRRAERINLFDTYLGDGLVQHWPDAKRIVAGPRYLNAAAQETEWLLKVIGEHADGAVVTVFTAYRRSAETGSSQVDIERAFKAMVGQSHLPGVKRLQLFLAPERDGNIRFPHERHVRCDDVAFEFSAGFDRLRFQQTRETFSLDYRWVPEPVAVLRDNENRARRAANKAIGGPIVLT